MLAEDSIDLVFLYKLQAEGKGRRIGQMLIREVAQTLPTLSPNYSLLCWYASPLTANKTEDLTDRLIQYYRQLPAINPGKDKQMMLWDPNEVLAKYGIEIRDRGARPGLLKKRGGRHCYYAVFYSGNDRISNTMLNSQIAAQKLTEMCRQALDTTARDMLEKHFPSGPLRTEEQKRQVKEDRLAGIKRALCGQSREGPTLWSFHVSHAQAAGVPNTLEVDDNNQAWASWSYGQIQCEAAQVPLREETVTSLVQTCTL
jgi:hypothetical protein